MEYMNHCKEFKCFPVQRKAPPLPLLLRPGSAQPKTKAWQETGTNPDHQTAASPGQLGGRGQTGLSVRARQLGQSQAPSTTHFNL